MAGASRWPLAGYSNEPQQGDTQQEKINEYYYDLEGGIFKYFQMDEKGSAISSPMRSEAFEGSTQVRRPS
eukprot:SAG25_NODE_5008_length_715_cov_1.436688_1_plen_70_part_00